MDIEVAKPFRMLSAYFITTAMVIPPSACKTKRQHQSLAPFVYSVHLTCKKIKNITSKLYP